MVRAPCCEKMGLKKGPWTPEEDQILINYVNQFGHGNWRALPKQAGLLRCGKSCRLRWMNYLRPDIKRGNFSNDEEETIIKLHEELGNRWSAIAARLPGRTDNEIKNVWHTHLKKRLKKNQENLETTPQKNIKMHKNEPISEEEPKPMNSMSQDRPGSPENSASSSDISSVTTASDNTVSGGGDAALDGFPQVDENFWSQVFSTEDSSETSHFPAPEADPQAQFQFSPLHEVDNVYGYNPSIHDHGMDFWFSLYSADGESLEF